MLDFDITYPGVPNGSIRSASYVRGHGIAPGQGSFVVTPNTSVAESIGDVEFRFGTLKLKLPGCRIGNGTASGGTSSPFLWRIAFQDRRWAWQFSKIRGKYNQRDTNGKVDTSVFAEKTPQQLAKLCLDAMGEKGYDVSKLPDTTRPAVDWDSERADVALETLCTSLGCRVVLKLDNKVYLLPQGEGKQLPRDGIAMNYSLGHSRDSAPGKLEIEFGPNLNEAKWELEAVGEDTDGTIKLLDALSYKPTDGWGHAEDVDPDTTYTDDGETKNVIDLARRTVYRYWRIKKLVGSAAAPDRGIERFLLNDFRALKDADGRPQKAVVEGRFTDYFIDPTTTTAGTAWPGSFTIDRERRLVILDGDDRDFGAWKESDGEITAGEMYLRTSYNLINKDDGALERHYETKKLSDSPGTKTIRAHYLSRTRRQVYTSATTPGAIVDNLEDLKAEAKRLFDLEVKRLAPQTADDLQYAGMRRDIDLDGAISQVQVEMDISSGCTMRWGRNNEPSIIQEPYEERRRKEREKDAEERETAPVVPTTPGILVSRLVLP